MNPERLYRQTITRSSTSLGLVLVLYDLAIDSLHRASRALAAGAIEERTKELNRVLGALGELQSSLDFERGGEVAKRLQQFYTLMRGMVLEAQVSRSNATLAKVLKHIELVRSAWIEVEGEAARNPPPSAGQAAAPRPAAATTDEEVTMSRWSA